MKTVLNDLESHNLTLTEVVNMAQNRPPELAGCEWQLVQATYDDDDWLHCNIYCNERSHSAMQIRSTLSHDRYLPNSHMTEFDAYENTEKYL